MKQQMTFNFVNQESCAAAPHSGTLSTQPTLALPLRIVRPRNRIVDGVTRPIHYLGSKLRIVESVREALDRVDRSHGPICDLFAGSGTVSRALSSSRTVIAADTQEYSRVLCSAMLHPARLPNEQLEQYLDKACSTHSQRLLRVFEPLIVHETKCRRDAEAGRLQPLCELLENGAVILSEQDPKRIKDRALHLAMQETLLRMRKARIVPQREGLAIRYFGGVYFSYFQACQIDMLSEAIGVIPDYARDTVLAGILSTASELVNTVGKQFAQPLRPRSSDGSPKPDLADRVARDRDLDGIVTFRKWIARYLAIPASKRRHQAWRCDYREALQKLDHQDVSVVYADPPYTRDHYSRFYHVLETLCLRDFPALSTVRLDDRDQISRGVYRLERYQSPFCIKSKAPHAFSALFSETRRVGVPLVLSYSPFKKETGARPRLVSINDLVQLAKKSYRSVEVVAAPQ